MMSNGEETDTPDETDRETPFTRLRDLFVYAFTKADYDDPHTPDAPEEFKEFGSNTLFITTAGFLFGWSKQLLTERRGPQPKAPAGFDTIEQAELLRELRKRRIFRILNSTVSGGLWCGWLGALYFGTEGLSAYARQVRDPWNTVIAAWTSGSVFGFAVGGSGFMPRLRSAAAAFFLAGLVGYPIGYLQLYINGLIHENGDAENTNQSKHKNTIYKASKKQKKTPYPVRDYDVVSAVVKKLDQSLEDADRFK